MKKDSKKVGRVQAIIFIFLTLFVSNAAQAIDAEFKNSLTKVELTKTNENSYNVNLYTSKKYTEPVKIIKKSDLNYYILLPETKNAAAQTSINTTDIRSVNTKLYKYAGADVENGYTKIDINTSKPINFNIAIKNASQTANAAAPVAVAQNKQVQNNESLKAQKKNSDFQKNKEQNIAPKKIAQQSAPKNVKNIAPTTKKIQKTASKPIQKSTPKAAQKAVQKPTQKAIQTAKTVQKTATKKETTNVSKPIEKEVVKEQAASSPDEIKPQDTTPISEQAPQNAIENYNVENIENTLDEENLKEIERIATSENKTGFFESAAGKIKSLKSYLVSIKNKMSNKLKEYGLSVRDIALMLIAGLLSFIIMLIVLTKKSPQPRLKSKADLLGKNDKTKLTPKKQPDCKVQKPNDGQYFIFDKNIKQTGFCDPATSAIKRNYELSSYDPDLRDNYKRAQIEPYGATPASNKNAHENEYDIIQKILKEDSLIEIAPGEFEEVAAQAQTKSKTPATSPIKEKPVEKKAPQKEEIMQEPTVLSSVEIAPERGFMCVSYNDNINLVGYIFDDVFALHNFKAPKLENYEIKFRLTEKDDKSASFIVKVDKTKMLIKVTKSTMGLEVVM